MFWKKYDDGFHPNAWILSSNLEDGYEEMDDDLFDTGFDGCFYLKSFLENPDAEYLARKTEREKYDEIMNLKNYLASTDYVISKLNELKLEDDEEYEKTKADYTEVLVKRKEARTKINELEAKESKQG